MSDVTLNGSVPNVNGEEKNLFVSPVLGRIAGVAGAALGTGLSIYDHGPTPSNILGGLIGGCTGYLAGSFADNGQLGIEIINEATSKSKHSPLSIATKVVSTSLCFYAGYSTSMAVDILAGGLNNFITKRDNEIVIELPSEEETSAVAFL